MQLSKETSLYKEDAIKEGIENASQIAESYITEVGSTGITVHPFSGDSNRVEIDGNGMNVVKGNVSVASYGDTARIGKESQAKVVIQPSGVDMYGYDASASNPQKLMAHIGYASGNAESDGQTDTAPYYTFGTRGTGAIGNYSFTSGVDNNASGYSSFATGSKNTVSKSNSVAMGHSNTVQNMAFAIGLWLTTGKNGQIVLGHHNDLDTSSLVVVGAGTGSSPKNVLTLSEGGALSVAGSIRIGNKTINDFVTEQNTSSGWTYRKWNSGKVEAWKTHEFSNVTFSSAGNLYRSPALSVSLPSVFTSTPIVMATSTASSVIVGCSFSANSASAIGGYMFKLNANTASHTVNFYAIQP